MNEQLSQKLLKEAEAILGYCLYSHENDLYHVFVSKNGIKIRAIMDDDFDEKETNQNVNTNIITNIVYDNIPINHDNSHIICIANITKYRQDWMDADFVKNNFCKKFHKHMDLICKWDVIMVSFENGEFGLFYIDMDNALELNTNIIWIIKPGTHPTYAKFLKQLQQKSLGLLYIAHYPYTKHYIIRK